MTALKPRDVPPATTQAHWEAYEKDFIREVAQTMDPFQIAVKLERPFYCINRMIRTLGLVTPFQKKQQWRPEEEELFARHTDQEIVILTGRTHGSVRDKRYNMRRKGRAEKGQPTSPKPVRYMRRWTREEDNRLRLLAGMASVDQISMVNGRTPGSISRRASSLGISLAVERDYVRAEKEQKSLQAQASRHPSLLAAAEAMGMKYHTLRYRLGLIKK